MPLSEYNASCSAALHQLQHFIDGAVLRGDLKSSHKGFLLSRCQPNGLPMGTFRIRAKVHKSPMESRPICNLSSSWVQPFALLMCKLLQPLALVKRTVVDSSARFLEQVKALTVPDDHVLLVVDAKNLYPSIDHRHLCDTLGQVVRHSPSIMPGLAMGIL